MREFPPREIFGPRRKPHRLPRCEYQKLYQPVFFAACSAKRRPLLLTNGLQDLIRDLIEGNAASHGCEVIACCLMPDHLHALACVTEDGGDVLSFFEGFKNGVANAALHRGFSKVWQRDFWDRHTRNDLDLWRCVQYILHNPVEEGLCERPEDWRYTFLREYPWQR